MEQPPNQGGRRSATSVGATTAPQLGHDITKFEALTRLYGIECTYIRGIPYGFTMWYTRATSFKSCACCMYLRMDHCARVQCQSSCTELRAQPSSPALHFFDPRPNTDIGTCR